MSIFRDKCKKLSSLKRGVRRQITRIKLQFWDLVCH